MSESDLMEKDLLSLKESFVFFTKETSQLKASYQTLQDEFKKLQSTCDSSTAALSSIVDSMSEGLIFISIHGTIELFNDAACQLIGLSIEKALHSSYGDHFSDDFFGFSMEHALNGAPVARKAFLSWTIGNHLVDVEISSSVIPKKGILVLLTDLTLQKHLEKTIARNERLRDLGEMAAALAHEIRNPLGGIQGFASLLCRDLDSFPEKKEMANAILEGTRSLNRLVTNVLNYAKPMEVHHATFDGILMIEETLALIKAELSADFHYFFEHSHAPIPIFGDKELLKMAVLNLVKNGIQASSKTSLVKIFIDHDAENVFISIVDQGHGIPVENLEKIFLPFFTTKPSGNGLGLAEAQKIAHAHGGTIDVHSEMGIGSTFILKVPSYVADRKNPHC